MTAMTRGPLPPSVYWRRRAFVIGLVLALVLLAVNLFHGGDPAPSDSARTVASGTQPDGVTPAQRKRAKHKKSPGRAKQDVVVGPVAPPAPVLAPPVGTCDDSDIVVSPDVSSATAGRPVTITLRLRTANTEACTWHVARGHLVVKIADGDDEVWASRECPRQVPVADVVVRRDVTSTLTLTWTARRSEEGCAVHSRWVLPGTYQIVAAAIGGEPDSSEFELAEPAPEVITVPPKKTGKHGGTKDTKRGEKKPARR